MDVCWEGRSTRNTLGLLLAESSALESACQYPGPGFSLRVAQVRRLIQRATLTDQGADELGEEWLCEVGLPPNTNAISE